MRHFGVFSNIMEVLETLEKLGKQIVVKGFWELWKACSKVNICCPTRCLWYLPWRWGLRWKFGVVFWYWSPLDTSSGKWGQPFRHLYTKTIWRPVNYCAKYKWRWRNRQYCTGVVLRGVSTNYTILQCTRHASKKVEQVHKRGQKTTLFFAYIWREMHQYK